MCSIARIVVNFGTNGGFGGSCGCGFHRLFPNTFATRRGAGCIATTWPNWKGNGIGWPQVSFQKFFCRIREECLEGSQVTLKLCSDECAYLLCSQPYRSYYWSQSWRQKYNLDTYNNDQTFPVWNMCLTDKQTHELAKRYFGTLNETCTHPRACTLMHKQSVHTLMYNITKCSIILIGERRGLWRQPRIKALTATVEHLDGSIARWQFMLTERHNCNQINTLCWC